MTEHEITIIRYPERVTLECSCKMILLASTNAVIPWEQASLAVMEHLRPQAEAMMKELLKMVSFKDIIRTLRTIRKLSSADRLVLDQDHPGNQRDQQDRRP